MSCKNSVVHVNFNQWEKRTMYFWVQHWAGEKMNPRIMFLIYMNPTADFTETVMILSWFFRWLRICNYLYVCVCVCVCVHIYIYFLFFNKGLVLYTKICALYSLYIMSQEKKCKNLREMFNPNPLLWSILLEKMFTWDEKPYLSIDGQHGNTLHFLNLSPWSQQICLHGQKS